MEVTSNLDKDSLGEKLDWIRENGRGRIQGRLPWFTKATIFLRKARECFDIFMICDCHIFKVCFLQNSRAYQMEILYLRLIKASPIKL